MDDLPVVEELASLRAVVAQLRAEKARLLRLLELTPKQAAPPGPAQTGFFDGQPGLVDRQSAPETKVAFFAALFAARTDIYATRWENTRTGKSGWLPAVRGGWRKGTRHEDRDHLPLTREALRAHLTGESHVGLYPLLDGDMCWWLAADFDGPTAMLDALAYLKAARSWSVPAALEVSRSGIGAHTWVFFTAPVPAESARRLGTALLREAMAVRGHMDLASYDRLFPSQDVLPAGGVGNLIAAPMHGGSRATGTTLFLDLATMEPHDDQWEFLSTLGRMSPAEVKRVARKAGQISVGSSIDRISTAVSTRIRVAPPQVVRARLAAGVRVETGELPPALHATLKHAASMPNPQFYERQRLRMSTWDTPRFLRSYDETLDGGLVLPRGLARTTQVVNDVTAALSRGRHCLVLTQWTTHVERFTDQLRQRGLDPIVLRGGMTAKARHNALTRLNTDTSQRLVVATGPFVGEGFDCPILDTLFLASPIAFKGRLVQYAGRILRPHPDKTTAEVHDYHDIDTGVLASSLAKRAPGYVSLGFSDPRKRRG